MIAHAIPYLTNQGTGRDYKAIRDQINVNSLTFGPKFEHFSDGCKKLISHMLEKDPLKRSIPHDLLHGD